MFNVETIQFKRGTKSQNDTHIGLRGSISIDMESYNVRLHDGLTPGGLFVIGRDTVYDKGMGGFITADETFKYGGVSNTFTPRTIDLTEVDNVFVYVNGNLNSSWEILNGSEVRVNSTMIDGAKIRVINFYSMAELVNGVIGTDSISDAFNTLMASAVGGTIAPLVDGKIPTEYLPSLGTGEYLEVPSLPATGDGTVTYVLTTDGDSLWRWTGTRYVEVTTTFDTTTLLTTEDTIDLGVVTNEY